MEMLRFLYKKWCSIPDKIRFFLVGSINAAFSYVIFAIALYLLGDKHYQACVILQWSLSSVFSYFNQKFFVFCTMGNYLKEYIKCCSTWAVSYVLNVVILEFLVRFMIKNVYVVQFISILRVGIVTYVLFKYFAFKVPNVSDDE